METLPYSEHKHEIKVQRAILAGQHPGQCDDKIKSSSLAPLWPIVKACWAASPGNRPTVSIIQKQVAAYHKQAKVWNAPTARIPPYPPELMNAKQAFTEEELISGFHFFTASSLRDAKAKGLLGDDGASLEAQGATYGEFTHHTSLANLIISQALHSVYTMLLFDLQLSPQAYCYRISMAVMSFGNAYMGLLVLPSSILSSVDGLP
jgi:hypothetical protein